MIKYHIVRRTVTSRPSMIWHHQNFYLYKTKTQL